MTNSSNFIWKTIKTCRLVKHHIINDIVKVLSFTFFSCSSASMRARAIRENSSDWGCFVLTVSRKLLLGWQRDIVKILGWHTKMNTEKRSNLKLFKESITD